MKYDSSQCKTLLSSPAVALIDLTMMSTAEVPHVNHFTISCINGERSPAQVELNIRKDNKILIFPKLPSFKVYKPREKEAVARDFRDLDNIGIFYCETTQEVPPLKVTLINNIGKGTVGCFVILFVCFSAQLVSLFNDRK